MAAVNTSKTIVGLGELLQVRRDNRDAPGGVAADAAITAARLGHRGIAVSRLGQDDAAASVLAALASIGVESAHLQSDPDLPTGRLSVRTIAGRTRRTLDHLAAFDQLQWDFDLEDLARRADVVLFSALGRRHGQARSTIDRMLDFARQSLRIFDLTVRADGELERSVFSIGLEAAEALIVDRAALDALQPGSRGEPVDVAISRLIAQYDYHFIIEVDAQRRFVLHTPDEHIAGEDHYEESIHTAAIIGLLDAVLDGHHWSRALRMASIVAQHTREKPDEPIARDALDAS